MPDSKTEKNKKIAFVMLAIIACASILSIGTNVFAQDTTAVEAPVPQKKYCGMDTVIVGTENWNGSKDISVSKFIQNIGRSTGIYRMIHQETAAEIAEEKAEEEAKHSAQAKDSFATTAPGWQYLIMIAVGFLIVYLGAAKGFEPLLLIPIGFGTILVNIPGAGMGNPPDGMLNIIYSAGVGNEFFPMLIFMGIGAMTDFGPLIANPKMALLGGAAQLGVFFTLFGVSLMNFIPGVDYNIMQAAAIAIIGGADGPTSIYVSGKLAPELMAVIAVAAYSYMALVPMIQPPIMKALTTKKERVIHMDQLRDVSKTERILFPLMLLVLTILLLPPAAPLIGMLAFEIGRASCRERV